MRQFPFPRIHGPDHDLCIRSMYWLKLLSLTINTEMVTCELVEDIAFFLTYSSSSESD